MKRKAIFALLCAAVILGGCGKKNNNNTDAVPTPSESPTPTAAVTEEVLKPQPITVIYKEVGEQTENSVTLILENKMGVDIEELYVRESSEKDWGENLMSSGVVIEDGDTAKIYIEELEEGSSYDIKMNCSEDKVEILEEVSPSDIEEAKVYLLEEEDLPYLVYVDAATGESVNTKEDVLKSHRIDSSSSSSQNSTDDDQKNDDDDKKTTPTAEPTKRPTATPTRTPDPTDEPDPEPTDEPDPEPTDEPEPTQTPDPGDDNGDDAPPPDDEA